MQFFFFGGGAGEREGRCAGGEWDRILSCGPSSRAPFPNTLEKTVRRAKRTSSWEVKNIRDLLGFKLLSLGRSP